MSDMLRPFEEKVLRAARDFVAATHAPPCAIHEYFRLCQALAALDVAAELAGYLPVRPHRATDQADSEDIVMGH